MKTSAFRILSLLSAALLASCSVVLDSQYGLRFEPIPQRAEPRTETANAAAPSPHYAAEAPGVAAGQPTVAVEFAADMWAVDPATEAVAQPEHTEFTVQRVAEPTNEAYEHTAVDQNTAEDWPRKKPERDMTWAWVLWAIPAVLTLVAAGGLLLNFGAHWYYLGNRRKGMARTIIWALTLVVTSMVYFLAATLGLNLAAALLAIFLLIPLAVIQIITMVTDFFALQKIAAKRARRSTRSNRGQTIT
jgi:hypothetical protein